MSCETGDAGDDGLDGHGTFDGALKRSGPHVIETPKADGAL